MDNPGNEVLVEASPRYSGKLQLIFDDGTIQYDDNRGLPSEFPLTEAEALEVSNTLTAQKA